MKRPISISRALGNVVVTLHGPVDAALLEETLAGLSDEREDVHLVIDLRDADTIDDQVIGVLVATSRHRKEQGGDLVLSAPRRRVHDALIGHGLTITATARP